MDSQNAGSLGATRLVEKSYPVRTSCQNSGPMMKTKIYNEITRDWLDLFRKDLELDPYIKNEAC